MEEKNISNKKLFLLNLLFVLQILFTIFLLIVVYIVLMLFFVTIESRNATVNLKPIIYLYPTEKTEISVNLEKKEDITVSYPKYKDGWNVIADPNGKLMDKDTGKELYSLYYESNNSKEFKIEEDGFIVESNNVASFLDEKLEILGLDYREREEFIVYWLPKLEANNYTYIRFATMNEIEENMPLKIEPKPDTLIRVLMTFKKIDKPFKVKKQFLEKVKRTGYTAVEWGGVELKY